jgi:hypothetical protein
MSVRAAHKVRAQACEGPGLECGAQHILRVSALPELPSGPVAGGGGGC